MRWFVVLLFSAAATGVASGLNVVLLAVWPWLTDRPALLASLASVLASAPWFATVAALLGLRLFILVFGATATGLAIGANLSLVAIWPSVTQIPATFVLVASVLASLPWFVPLFLLWRHGVRSRETRRALREELERVRRETELETGQVP